MASSAQLELDIYYLATSKLILTQLAYADTAYYTQFLCKAELQLKINLNWSLGGWGAGWVVEEINNKAKVSLNWI